MRKMCRIPDLHIFWFLGSHVNHHQFVLILLIYHLSPFEFRSVLACQLVFLPRIVRRSGQNLDQTKVKQSLEKNVVIEIVEISPLKLACFVSHSFL